MSLILTRMQNFRAQSNLDRWELRASQYGAYDWFLAETNNPNGIITPELLETANRAQGNTLETPVYDLDQSVTINNTRTVTVSDDENTSAMQTITFTTYEFGFTMIPAQYTNNEFGYQRDFNRKLNKYLIKFAETLDTAAVAALSSARTQVLSNTLGKYSFTSNTVAATLAQKTRVLADLHPLMAGNDFYGDLHVIGNPGMDSIVRELAENGQYNSTNNALQFMGKTFHYSNRVSDALNKIATAYATVGGTAGIVSRVDRDSRLRHSTHKHDFDVVNVPLVNLPMGVYRYDDVADKSSITGAATADLTRTKVEAWSWSVDIAFVTPYNSDAANLAGPILKFDVADS